MSAGTFNIMPGNISAHQMPRFINGGSSMAPNYINGTWPQRQVIFSENLSKLAEGQVVITTLKACHSRVSVCYGCGEFLKPGGIAPPPPEDLVLVCRLRRKFRKDGQDRISDQASNVYFKLHDGLTPWHSYVCLSKAIPNYGTHNILLHGEAMAHLSAHHKEKIVNILGLSHLSPFL